MIKVIKNGFFDKFKLDDPDRFTFRDKNKAFWEKLENPQPYSSRITRETLESIAEELGANRPPVFITGEAGMRSFHDALQSYIELELPRRRDEAEGITREQFEAAYPRNTDGPDFQESPFITGTSPQGEYVAGFDPALDLAPNVDNGGEYGIVIQSPRRSGRTLTNAMQLYRRMYEQTGMIPINPEELPDSMTTVREFRTEQEAIQYLDNISND